VEHGRQQSGRARAGRLPGREFPAEEANFSGEMAKELQSLVDRGLAHVLDSVIVRKDADGAVEAVELHDTDDSELGQLRAIETDLAMLLAESDIEKIGTTLEPGSLAAVLVYENSWAAPWQAAPSGCGRWRRAVHPTAALPRRPSGMSGSFLVCCSVGAD
jgi:hypothetical protein